MSDPARSEVEIAIRSFETRPFQSLASGHFKALLAAARAYLAGTVTVTDEMSEAQGTFAQFVHLEDGPRALNPAQQWRARAEAAERDIGELKAELELAGAAEVEREKERDAALSRAEAAESALAELTAKTPELQLFKWNDEAIRQTRMAPQARRAQGVTAPAIGDGDNREDAP